MKTGRVCLTMVLAVALGAGCAAAGGSSSGDPADVATDAGGGGPAGPDATNDAAGDTGPIDAGTPDAGGGGGGGGTGADTSAVDATGDAGVADTSDAGGPGDAAMDDAVDAGPTAAEPIAVEFCVPLATVQCEAAVACGCADPFADPPGAPADLDACVTSESHRCLETLGPLADLIDAGVLHVVPERAAACREALAGAAVPCEELQPLTTALWCRGVFSLAADIGDPCDGDICAEGLGWCDAGSCAPLPEQGQPCQGLCAAGLLCAPGGVCAPPAKGGDACTPEGLPCAPPHHCIGGTCRAAVPVGEACEQESDCAPGLTCTDAVCAEVPAACEPESPCGAEALCFGVPIRQCAEKLAETTPCQSDEVCIAGTYCSDETETCTPLPGDGEPCAKGILCAEGLACAGDFSACGPLPGLGAPCGFGLFGPILCAGELGCIDGTCSPLPGPDQPCTLDNRCDDLDLDGDGQGGDLGCDFQVSGSFCVARRDAGGICQNDLVCKDGLFCDFATLECSPVYETGVACSLGNECGPVGSCIPNDVGDFACQPLGSAPGDPCFLECGGDLWCDFHLEAASCAPKGCLVIAP